MDVKTMSEILIDLLADDYRDAEFFKQEWRHFFEEAD